MNQKLLEHIASKSLKSESPKIIVGMTVKVSQKIREGDKERLQNFEGLVIAVNGSGINETFTVRRIVGGIGVEKIFPIHSKNVVKIEILKKAKVRRSKLYFMRNLRGKAARMSETHIREVALDDAAVAEKAKNEELKAQNEEVVDEQKVEVEAAPEPEAETAEKPVEKAEAEEPKKD